MKLILTLSQSILPQAALDAPVALPEEITPLPLYTHSRQVSWLLHGVMVEQQWFLLALEAYSRYVMVIPFHQGSQRATTEQLPCWEELLSNFLDNWLEHTLAWMTLAGVLREKHEMRAVIERFLALETPLCVRHRDRSMRAHITSATQALLDYIRESQADSFGKLNGIELSDTLNQRTCSAMRADGTRERFVPAELFVADMLYRFGDGFCRAQNAYKRNFPNPHQRQVKLALVGPQAQGRH